MALIASFAFCYLGLKYKPIPPVHIDATAPTHVFVGTPEFRITDEKYIVAPTEIDCVNFSHFGSPLCVIGGGFLSNIYFTDAYGRPLARREIQATATPLISEQVFGYVPEEYLNTGVPVVSGLKFTEDGRLLAAVFSHNQIVELGVARDLELTVYNVTEVARPVGVTISMSDSATIHLDRKNKTVVRAPRDSKTTEFKLRNMHTPWDFDINNRCMAVSYPQQDQIDLYLLEQSGIQLFARVAIDNPKYVELKNCNVVVGSNENIVIVNVFDHTVTKVLLPDIYEIRGFHIFESGILVAHNTQLNNWEHKAGTSFVAVDDIESLSSLLEQENTLIDLQLSWFQEIQLWLLTTNVNGFH